MKTLEVILETFPEENFTIATGFNEAIIGLDEYSMRIIYSQQKCIDMLMKEGMEEDEAIEYFEYNVLNAYIGEKTPIWSFP